MYNRGIERCHAGSSSLLRAKREPEMVLALAARGQSAFALGLSSLLRAKREPEKHPLLSRRGRHEKGAARPFQTPKGLSKRKKASRCAKTGCGSQRLLRCRSHPAGRGPNSSSLFPPLAAVVAVARKGLLAPFRPRRGSRNGKKLVAALNAFFSFLRFAASQLVLPLC